MAASTLDILEQAVAHYASTRAVGHTHSMLNGAVNSDNCMVVVATRAAGHHVAQAGIPENRIISMLSMPSNLAGRHGPLAWDNHALEVLLHSSCREIYRLQGENARLRERLEAGDVNGSA